MNGVALFILALAVGCFIAGIYVPKLTNVGLALLTVGLIIEFGAKTHSVTF